MKTLRILLFFVLATLPIFAQKKAVGISYNAGLVLGEVNQQVRMPLGVSNWGVVYKNHLNQRIASRFTFAHLSVSQTTLNELTAGVDYHFKKFNPYKSHSPQLNSTAYVVLEASVFHYQSPSKSGLSSALPLFGIGYKKCVDYHWQWSVENKTKLSFTDALDGNSLNKSTFDSYNYTSLSIFYTFGKLKGTERINF